MVSIIIIVVVLIAVFIASGIITDRIYKKVPAPVDHLHKMNFYRTYGVVDEDMKMLGHLHVFNCSCGAKKIDLQLTTKPL